MTVGVHIDELIAPLTRSEIKMFGHIPYARRRITAVFPSTSGSDNPPFERELLRVVTEKAPWTDDEGWRRQKMPAKVDLDGAATEESNGELGPLEREASTADEPDNLDIWVERVPLGLADPYHLVGMALRGRWGLFGPSKEQCWWAFKVKGCESWRRTILPRSCVTNRRFACYLVEAARSVAGREAEPKLL